MGHASSCLNPSCLSIAEDGDIEPRDYYPPPASSVHYAHYRRYPRGPDDLNDLDELDNDDGNVLGDDNDLLEDGNDLLGDGDGVDGHPPYQICSRCAAGRSPRQLKSQSRRSNFDGHDSNNNNNNDADIDEEDDNDADDDADKDNAHHRTNDPPHSDPHHNPTGSPHGGDAMSSEARQRSSPSFKSLGALASIVPSGLAFRRRSRRTKKKKRDDQTGRRTGYHFHPRHQNDGSHPHPPSYDGGVYDDLVFNDPGRTGSGGKGSVRPPHYSSVASMSSSRSIRSGLGGDDGGGGGGGRSKKRSRRKKQRGRGRSFNHGPTPSSSPSLLCHYRGIGGPYEGRRGVGPFLAETGTGTEDVSGIMDGMGLAEGGRFAASSASRHRRNVEEEEWENKTKRPGQRDDGNDACGHDVCRSRWTRDHRTSPQTRYGAREGRGASAAAAAASEGKKKHYDHDDQRGEGRGQQQHQQRRHHHHHRQVECTECAIPTTETKLISRTLHDMANAGVDVTDPAAVAGRQIYAVRFVRKRMREREGGIEGREGEEKETDGEGGGRGEGDLEDGGEGDDEEKETDQEDQEEQEEDVPTSAGNGNAGGCSSLSFESNCVVSGGVGGDGQRQRSTSRTLMAKVAAGGELGTDRKQQRPTSSSSSSSDLRRTDTGGSAGAESKKQQTAGAAASSKGALPSSSSTERDGERRRGGGNGRSSKQRQPKQTTRPASPPRIMMNSSTLPPSRDARRTSSRSRRGDNTGSTCDSSQRNKRQQQQKQQKQQQHRQFPPSRLGRTPPSDQGKGGDCHPHPHHNKLVSSIPPPLCSHTNSYNNNKCCCSSPSAYARGCSSYLFGHDAVRNNRALPVDDLVCVDEKSGIYVCDTGLTAEECGTIIDVTERCSRGTYAAYTYAKQTLGCREHDELASVCFDPVMTACATVRERLNGVGWGEGSRNGEDSNDDGAGGDDAPQEPEAEEQLDEVEPEPAREEQRPDVRAKRREPRELVLDDREPHLVKYDVSRKERQKLDMHTDKSEWTFLISLSEGCGLDYEGGGTYFEAIDSTVHLQRGHALIFRGKLRHRGQKITAGYRFLLVGFLVDKDGEDEKEKAKPGSQSASAVSTTRNTPLALDGK